MSVTARIGELLVNITASAKGFVNPVRQSRKELSDFKGEVTATGFSLSSLRGVMATIGGGLTFAGAIASARAYMIELDGVGKAAAKIGIATDKLIGLRFGGEQSGLDGSVIDKSLQKLAQRTSEAAIGTGEAVKVLDELKLSAAELSKLPADRQLYAIADAMQAISSQGDKIRIATKLFEEEGVGVLNLIKDGSPGLRKFSDEARDLGIAFGTDAVGGVEAANDAINRLKHTLGGIGQAIVIELAPEVERVSNNLTKALKEFRESPVDIMGVERGKPNRFYDGASAVGGFFSGLYDSYYNSVADFEARRQISKGIAAGTAAPEIGLQRMRAAGFNPGIDAAMSDIDQKLTELEQRYPKPNLEKGLSYLVDKGIEGGRGWADWARGDGLKQLTDAAKKMADAQQSIREGLRGAAFESLIRPPGWTVERERHAEARRQREKDEREDKAKRRRALEDRLHLTGPTSLNSAIEVGSAEAFRLLAENKVAKAHLEVARESKRLLEAIDKGIEGIQVAGVGL